MESLEMMPARTRIVAILKKALLAGEYKSGEELSLTGVAEQLGVSRTPVREAFQTLAAEGLIELRMNRGAIVKSIDEKFIRDHYEMRALLEGEAAAKAAVHHMDPSELLARLYHLSDNLHVIDPSAYNELNQDLHLSIWKAADNQKLFSILSSLWNGPSVGYANSQLEHFQLSTREHIQVLKAIEAGDSEKARSCMNQHILRSMDNMLQSFQKMQQAHAENKNKL